MTTELPPIERIPPAVLAALALELEIEDQVTGNRTRFVPSTAQLDWWTACYAHAWVYGYKARQVWFTTATLVDDMAFTKLNTDRGHRIETWLVWDTDAKVGEQIERIHDFMTQLGWAHRYISGKHTILLPRGRLRPSKIVGMTAGGKRIGAGLTCHRRHDSELPFWPDPEGSWRALAPAQNLSAVNVIETTMKVGSPLAHRLWHGANGYFKHFVPVELHTPYRARPLDGRRFVVENGDEVELDQATEAFLVDEGFTRRDTMAWMVWAKTNKGGGDWTETLREYPQKPEHGFQFALGRWIRLTPRVLPYRLERVKRPIVGSTSDRELHLKVFRPPEETSGQCVVSVDTAGKRGKTRSTVVVIDKRDSRLCASFVDGGDSTYRELAAVAAHASRRYTRLVSVWPYEPRMEQPPVVVEVNGIGEATAQEVEALSVPLHRLTADDVSKEQALDHVRAKAEARTFEGPEELVEEANSLRKEKKHDEAPVVWRGLKDLCMAYGNGCVFVDGAPFQAPPVEPTPEVFNLSERMGR